MSYARSDRVRVERLVHLLEAEGFSVWWDRDVGAGSEFAPEIERELDSAKAVVVCWSAAGAKSPWVRDEAGQASTEGKLVSVSLDGSLPPLGFRQYHAAPLAKWRGKGSDPDVRALIDSIAAKLGRESSLRTAASHSGIGQTAARVAIAVIALLSALLVYQFVDRRAAIGEAEQDRAVSVQSASIAVLPFADLSPLGNQGYFADGMAEEISNVLSRVDGLRVAPRTSSFQFRDRKGVATRDIASVLGVKHFLEGSVRRAGNQVRISAQLVDAENDVELWSQTFDETLTMDNLLAIQDEIASGIVKALSKRMSLGHADALKFAAAADTKSLDAYADYLRGQSLFASRTAKNYPQVVAAFQSAVAKDPRFTRAWVGLGGAYSVASTFLSDDDYSEGDFPSKAEEAVRRAMALEPDFAMTHSVAANVALMKGYNSDSMTRAMDGFDKALQLDPREPLAYNWRAQLKATVGDLAGAKEDISKTIAIDPGDTVAHGLMVALHLYEDDVAGALKAQRSAGRYLPTLSDSLALALARRGDRSGTEEVVKLMGGEWQEYSAFIEQIATGRVDPAAAQSRMKDILPKLDSRVPTVLTPFRLHMARRFDELAQLPEGNFPIYWMRSWPAYLQHPARYRNMMDRDLSRYWKRHGYPPKCRAIAPVADGRDFECS